MTRHFQVCQLMDENQVHQARRQLHQRPVQSDGPVRFAGPPVLTEILNRHFT